MEGRGERKLGVGWWWEWWGGGVCDVASAQQILLWFLFTQKVKVLKKGRLQLQESTFSPGDERPC